MTRKTYYEPIQIYLSSIPQPLSSSLSWYLPTCQKIVCNRPWAFGFGFNYVDGWSGFVVIAESHISIHTFPTNGFLSADVYTCKNGMDTEFILNYFKENFDLKEIEHNFIKRGTKYGKL